MLPNCDFYQALPVQEDFSSITRRNAYHILPSDWYVLVADIENSTQAISEGHYKAVNLIGVSVISAVLNIAKPTDFPFIFGGDGSSLCIWEEIVPQVRDAMIDLQHIAKIQYGLNLRVGLVPISDINKTEYEVLVAKHRISQHYIQAAFSGGGMDYAERCIKERVNTNYLLNVDSSSRDVKGKRANFTGLECRWNEIPSPSGEVISLIIKAKQGSATETAETYRECIRVIEQIFGDVEACPVREEQLKLSLKPKELSFENRIRVYGKNFFYRAFYPLSIRCQVIGGWIMMQSGLTISGTDWGSYKKTVVANTDFKKFDDTLRLLINGDEDQLALLESFLEAAFQSKKLAYGIYCSKSTLMTCLIEERSGKHFHFVDGSMGGYTNASIPFKKRLKLLTSEHREAELV